MKNSPKIEISELFLIRTSHNKTFKGKIFRETFNDGKVHLHGNTIVNEGKIWSTGSSEKEIMNNLNEICAMKLNMKLHGNKGNFIHLRFLPSSVFIADIIFLN